MYNNKVPKSTLKLFKIYSEFYRLGYRAGQDSVIMEWTFWKINDSKNVSFCLSSVLCWRKISFKKFEFFNKKMYSLQEFCQIGIWIKMCRNCIVKRYVKIKIWKKIKNNSHTFFCRHLHPHWVFFKVDWTFCQKLKLYFSLNYHIHFLPCNSSKFLYS